MLNSLLIIDPLSIFFSRQTLKGRHSSQRNFLGGLNGE
jgi:hypothetical protein